MPEHEMLSVVGRAGHVTLWWNVLALVPCLRERKTVCVCVCDSSTSRNATQGLFLSCGPKDLKRQCFPENDSLNEKINISTCLGTWVTFNGSGSSDTQRMRRWPGHPLRLLSVVTRNKRQGRGQEGVRRCVTVCVCKCLCVLAYLCDLWWTCSSVSV